MFYLPEKYITDIRTFAGLVMRKNLRTWGNSSWLYCASNLRTLAWLVWFWESKWPHATSKRKAYLSLEMRRCVYDQVLLNFACVIGWAQQKRLFVSHSGICNPEDVHIECVKADITLNLASFNFKLHLTLVLYKCKLSYRHSWGIRQSTESPSTKSLRHPSHLSFELTSLQNPQARSR